MLVKSYGSFPLTLNHVTRRSTPMRRIESRRSEVKFAIVSCSKPATGGSIRVAPVEGRLDGSLSDAKIHHKNPSPSNSFTFILKELLSLDSSRSLGPMSRSSTFIIVHNSILGSQQNAFMIILAACYDEGLCGGQRRLSRTFLSPLFISASR